jgi:steroid 5-alpha reductase family enzyme
VALSVPYGVIGVIGPLIITFLIIKISGIPLLEKRMKEKSGFEDYAKKTSIFFPLPVKNK